MQILFYFLVRGSGVNMCLQVGVGVGVGEVWWYETNQIFPILLLCFTNYSLFIIMGMYPPSPWDLRTWLEDTAES